MLCLCGFEQYSRWVPLVPYRIAFRGGTKRHPECCGLALVSSVTQAKGITVPSLVSFKICSPLSTQHPKWVISEGVVLSGDGLILWIAKFFKVIINRNSVSQTVSEKKRLKEFIKIISKGKMPCCFIKFCQLILLIWKCCDRVKSCMYISGLKETKAKTSVLWSVLRIAKKMLLSVLSLSKWSFKFYAISGQRSSAIQVASTMSGNHKLPTVGKLVVSLRVTHAKNVLYPCLFLRKVG